MHLGLLAWMTGTLVIAAVIVGIALAAYSVWYIFFKLGK
jgi:hypothetical protein